MKQKKYFIIGIIIILIFAVTRITMGLVSDKSITDIILFISTFLLFGFSLFHGIKRYGIKTFVTFFFITFIVSWLYENVSIITGFPFGHYYYTAALGPKLWNVPVYIMFAYFATGYLSWILAHILLDKFDGTITKSDLFFIPFISSFIMVFWDISTDPACSTIGKLWIWKNGGAYFGVPFVNFLGWFLCVYTIYQLFALYLLGRKNTLPEVAAYKIFWILPTLMYLFILLKFPFDAIFSNNKEIMSFDNHLWWTSDIYRAMLLISIFTMGFTGFLSLAKLFKSSEFSKNSK